MSLNQAADKIVDQFINKLADEIKGNLRGYGYSDQNVRADVKSDTEGTIYGWKWIKTLEGGRGPTRPDAAKGTPTLREAILAWINKKGIVFTKSVQLQNKVVIKTIGKDQMAYMIAAKMHRDGNKLFRDVHSGKAPQLIFSNVITDERVESFIMAYSNSQVLYMKSDIINSFKD
ncbi:MAG TPA: hypothetical protein VJY62_02475 [Bacteroidia bacterium]|nr:hypothetical protein [Bacteroidia bacterium]